MGECEGGSASFGLVGLGNFGAGLLVVVVFGFFVVGVGGVGGVDLAASALVLGALGFRCLELFGKSKEVI